MPWLACKSRRIHYELTGPEDGPACVLVKPGLLTIRQGVDAVSRWPGGPRILCCQL